MDDRKRRKILKEFGQMLREVREQKGLSIQGLADIADLDRSNLSNIENGKVEISLCTLYVIAEALELDPCALLPKKRG
jgi:transcriptional regulator with XRE-family HTH domain